jgi:hypothetical protein
VPERRDELAAVIRAIADAIAATPPTAMGERVDRALLFAYLDELVPDDDDRSGAALADAVASLAHSRVHADLFGGTTALGWAIAHLTSGDMTELTCGRIDAALLEQIRTWSGTYDLVAGVTGIGVYALERGEAGRPLAHAVLDFLQRAAVPRPLGCAWHTPASHLPGWQQETAPTGYWNLGMAHGSPGVIALLARFVAAGVDASQLLRRGVEGLLAMEPPREGGRFPAYHMGAREGPTTPTTEGRHRLAWCYGDLGVSLALLAAATAMNNASWRTEALMLARNCATRDEPIVDTMICHGTAGIAHMFHRLNNATGDALFAAAAKRWVDRTLALRSDAPLAGFPCRMTVEGREEWHANASILIGAAGVALVLAAMITEQEPAWDRRLLVDV